MLLETFEKLGIMGWPLVICSVLAAMVMLERLVFILRFRLTKKRQLASLTGVLNDYRDCSKTLRDEAVGVALEQLKLKALSGIRFLRILSTLSPLLGLLGTIFGIVAAFKVIAAQTGPVSPNLIADGLWEAMLTTGFGLMIALPCLFTAYFFQMMAEKQLVLFAHLLNQESVKMEAEKERAIKRIAGTDRKVRGHAA